jgi:phosphoribosyl-ATP pyrophosphohydrolase
MSRFAEVLARLSAVIESRKGGDPAASYTARLLANPTLAGKKLGEEAIETVIAATQGDAGELAGESADLIYHWLVVLAAAGVSLDDVAARLEAREGTSGLDEKAARKT